MSWTLHRESAHATIYGPGELTIVLRHFHPGRSGPGTILPPTVHGASVERHWRYPLEEGIWLEGISASKPEDPLNRPPLHLLHIGQTVYWHIPADFAEMLHTAMAGDTASDGKVEATGLERKGKA